MPRVSSDSRHENSCRRNDHHDRSRDRSRDRNWDKSRDKSLNRKRDRSQDRKQDRSYDRRQDRRQDRSYDQSHNRRNDRDSRKQVRQERSPYNRRSKESERESHRDRSPFRRNFRQSNKKYETENSLHGRAPKSSFLTNDEPEVWGDRKIITETNETKPVEKEKPNFAVSGKLVQDTNMVNGIVIKYSEPADAIKPKRKWRIYPFKDDQSLPVLHIHRCSAFLMGRDRKVADIPLDHPSCSKQHAALQFRLVQKSQNGTKRRVIRPYLIDLESANGTFINGVKMEPRKYYELFESDMMKFGMSSREYILMHDEHEVSDSEDADVSDVNTL